MSSSLVSQRKKPYQNRLKTSLECLVNKRQPLTSNRNVLPDFFAMSNRDKNNHPNSGSRQPYGRNLFRALGSQVVKEAVNMILKSSFYCCIGCQYKRVDFRIACFVFKSLNNLPPSYIQGLIAVYKPTRASGSSASISLKSFISSKSFVGRAFSFNAPKIWNNLSHGTRSCTTFQSFN